MKSLSKSQYVRGLQCHKSLWLYRHRKDLRTPVDAFQQSILDQGTAFGALARERFFGGVLITQGHDDPEGALKATSDAIAAGAGILYEAAFLYEDVLVRIDVMELEDDGAWSLFEVKSGTKVEDVHLLDVAIQRFVLNGAGIKIARAVVVHADPAYVRRGPLELLHLFALVDVTQESNDALAEVPLKLHFMKLKSDEAEVPTKDIGAHCTKPYECDFKAHCWAHVPAYSVFNLGYAKMEKKLELWNSGVKTIADIDVNEHKLTKGQVTQVTVARAGKAMVDRRAIEKFLGTLIYPLAHLDFETDNPVIPPYDGLRPYSQMPFQASVRVQQEPGAPLTEFGFLGDGLGDPRKALTDFLRDCIPPSGSVLAYHKSFEAGRLEELGAYVGYNGEIMRMIVARLADLADPFRTGLYAHPGFKGRWSIKAVLPVLVPSMTYEGLEIGDGAAAMAAYGRLRDPELPQAERERLMAALRVYCGQDTLAMVKILEHLYAVVEGAVKA